LALNPVSYDYLDRNENTHDVGFIAQEYKLVFPEQVGEGEGSERQKELTNGEPVLNITRNLDPYLVKAIQEQQAIIEWLVSEVKKLKGE
jgi:hypothetical protein